MLVKDVMSTEVITVSPKTPLAEVVELLIRRQLKAVPVVDTGHVVGIITGGDLLRRAEMGLRLSLQRALPPDVLADQLRQLSAQGKTAADVMTAPVVTVRDESRVSEAVRLMVEKRLKRLPVVDATGGLVGIISRLDVLATVASHARAGDSLPVLLAAAARTAGDIMFRDVPTASPDAPLSEVLNKLIATPLRRVVVVDESRRVLGIVVDAGLLAQISRQAAPGAFRSLLARLANLPAEPSAIAGRAADVMERVVFTVHTDTPLVEVIQQMIEKRVKRLVVTDAEERLIGMVDRASLLRAIGDER